MKFWQTATNLVAVIAFLGTGTLNAQSTNFDKYFKQFKQVAIGVDFYASNASAIAPFQKPVKEVKDRLVKFLGNDLASGVIVVCSSSAERDTVTETRMLKKGYRWALIQLTPEATRQEMLAIMKERMGGQISPELLERFTNRPPEEKARDESRMISAIVQRMAYAVISTTLNHELDYKGSRLEDMGRSPLVDWLDIGLAAYASDAGTNWRFIQDRLEEAFPLDDILSMSRPFVVPSEGGSGSGAGFGMRLGGGGGQRGGGQRAAAGDVGGRGNMPKDVQDRMMFDTQATALFSYLMETKGEEKMRGLVAAARAKKDLREILVQPEWLGGDMDAAEKLLLEWIRARKADPRGGQMRTGGPGLGPAPMQ